MPKIRLRATLKNGEGSVSHSFCDENGKAIFNARTVPLGKKELSSEDRNVISEYNKTGAERVSKWRSKLPVTYIDLNNLEWQLRPTGFTLLGKAVMDTYAPLIAANLISIWWHPTTDIYTMKLTNKGRLFVEGWKKGDQRAAIEVASADRSTKDGKEEGHAN